MAEEDLSRRTREGEAGGEEEQSRVEVAVEEAEGGLVCQQEELGRKEAEKILTMRLRWMVWH